MPSLLKFKADLDGCVYSTSENGFKSLYLNLTVEYNPDETDHGARGMKHINGCVFGEDAVKLQPAAYGYVGKPVMISGLWTRSKKGNAYFAVLGIEKP